MKKVTLISAVAVMVLAMGSVAQGVLVESTFEADDEGWTALGDTGSTLTRVTGGSASSWCMEYYDIAGGINDLYIAPVKFLGDWTGVQTLEFDFKTSVDEDGDGITTFIHSGSTSWSMTITPTTSWDTYVLAIEEASWSKLTGSLSFGDTLNNITALQIEAEVKGGVEYGYLDNVKLVPEPATIGLLGLGSLSFIRRKRKA